MAVWSCLQGGSCRSEIGGSSSFLGSLRSLSGSHKCGHGRRKKIGSVLFKGRHSIEVAGGMGFGWQWQGLGGVLQVLAGAGIEREGR